MAIKSGPFREPLFLGIEGGGTRTVALMADAYGREIRRIESGPGNVKLLTDAQLAREFRSLARRFPKPAALGIGMAGARTVADMAKIHRAAAKAWPRVACHATGDLETALAAAEIENNRRKSSRGNHPTVVPSSFATVLVLSGTGSCCFGKNAEGRIAKVGGWGHVLGDSGSAYQIGLQALRAVLQAHDRGDWPKVGQFILRSLLLNGPEALVDWAHQAGKAEIAALAVDVFDAWRARDLVAAKVVVEAAQELAAEADACGRRLAVRGQSVKFVLAGGTLLKQPAFTALISRRVRKSWPGAKVVPLRRESVWGAVELAWRTGVQASTAPDRRSGFRRADASVPMAALEGKALKLSPTERRNPRSANLDKLPVSKAIRLIISEDAKISRALLRERGRIGRGVNLIVTALRRGGRLFYVGAGTSGRLGVLDASECPPTFGTPPELVQGIIAGGQTALWRAVEGAEDDAHAGSRAIQSRGVNARDVVVGIAASGRTPFVWGALAEAKRRGAKTILLTFNPDLRIPTKLRPALVIAPDVGPEILTGSTRLKAGTATKLVLNMFTTLAMVRIGKVAGNLMVDLNPSNAKLRGRAARIVAALTGADDTAAREALEKTGWAVKNAVARIRRERARPSA